MSFNHKFSEKAGSFPEEYADALARDQAAAARAQQAPQAPQAPQAALPVPPTARPETRPPHVVSWHQGRKWWENSVLRWAIDLVT